MRKSLRVAVLASAIALIGVVAAGTVGARNSALATNSGSVSVSVSTPSVFEGNNFTVTIMQTSTVATSGAQADLTFDRTQLQVVSVTQGSAYTGPPASGLTVGVAPQTTADAINEANTTTSVLKNASVYYASTGGQPTIPPGTNQAIVITMQASHIQSDVTAAIGLANPEMIDSTGADMSVTASGGSITIRACYDHHSADSNADGYSDSDQCAAGRSFPASAPSATVGQNPSGSCLGRNLNGSPAQTTGAKLAKADLNLDGNVNILDLSSVASAPDYLTSSFTPVTDRRFEKDQNGDGNINILDLAIMASFHPPVVVASC